MGRSQGSPGGRPPCSHWEENLPCAVSTPMAGHAAGVSASPQSLVPLPCHWWGVELERFGVCLLLGWGWTLATSTVILVCVFVCCMAGRGISAIPGQGICGHCSQHQLRCLSLAGRQVLAVSGPVSVGMRCCAPIPISSQHGRPFYPSLGGD